MFLISSAIAHYTLPDSRALDSPSTQTFLSVLHYLPLCTNKPPHSNLKIFHQAPWSTQCQVSSVLSSNCVPNLCITLSCLPPPWFKLSLFLPCTAIWDSLTPPPTSFLPLYNHSCYGINDECLENIDEIISFHFVKPFNGFLFQTLSVGPFRYFMTWTHPLPQTSAPTKWCHIHYAWHLSAFFYLFGQLPQPSCLHVNVTFQKAFSYNAV